MDSLSPIIRQLDAYRTEGRHLPSKHAVAKLCADLLEVLFPGFLCETNERPTREKVEALASRLPDAREHVFRLIESLPAIRAVLQTDVEAAFEGDPASSCFEEIILAYPCIEAIAIQRCAHVLYRQNVPLIPRMMTEWAHSRTGIDIHPGAQIGSHFFIDHGTGVVIGETTVIGSHVKLYHGVTLGAKSFQKDEEGRILKGGKRHPDVGDRVTIYPNSTVLGGETVIGENSTIGGNVFLQHSVPANSLVYYEETQLKIVPKNDPLGAKPL